VAVTLPPRHYDLAGQVLARAVEDAARDGVPILQAVQRAAVAAGHRLGAAQRPRDEGSAAVPGDPTVLNDAALDDVAAVLDAHGYEPRVQGDRVVLANCPFHALAREHTALVCGMNLHLITALLDELGRGEVLAGLDPAPQRCCVTLTTEPD
jgi:predicted ArsR family transcriptional regulator